MSNDIEITFEMDGSLIVRIAPDAGLRFHDMLNQLTVLHRLPTHNKLDQTDQQREAEDFLSQLTDVYEEATGLLLNYWKRFYPVGGYPCLNKRH